MRVKVQLKMPLKLCFQGKSIECMLSCKTICCHSSELLRLDYTSRLLVDWRAGVAKWTPSQPLGLLSSLTVVCNPSKRNCLGYDKAHKK